MNQFEPRRERVSRVRREFILDAAERCMAEAGVRQSTMEEIAKRAGYTKQSLYAYFSSKDRIVAEVYLRLARDLNDQFRTAVAAKRESLGGEVLETLEECFLAWCAEKPEGLKLLAWFQTRDLSYFEDLGITEAVLAESEALSQMMAEALVAGGRDGSLDPGIDPSRGVAFLNALIAGAVGMAAYQGEYLWKVRGIEPITMMRELFDFGLRAFAPHGENR